MKFSQKQIVIVMGLLVVIVVSVVIFGANIRRPQTNGGGESPELEFKVWGYDDEAYIKKLIAEYGKYRKKIKIQYQKFDADKYDEILVDALASGEGPDIFMIGNRDLVKQKSKIAPVPTAQFGLTSYQRYFPEVAYQDFVADNQIYAMPLYVDTLALFYNKDFFDQVGITSPPKTWQEFQENVAKLRVLDEEGGILRAGAAIGGSERSVAHAADILNMIMLQNGTTMTNKGFTAAAFGSAVKQKNPGLEAFNFYLQFANAASSYYSWSDSEPNSLDGFSSEKVAMIFGYREDIKAIKKRNPFLKFGVDVVPQPEGAAKAVSYANYSGLTVSKQSVNSAWAWDFITYVTTVSQVADAYLKLSDRPPAIRDPLIKDSLNDLSLGVFSRQALTARDWVQVDPKKISEIFSNAIMSVLNGQKDSTKALKAAEEQVTAVMREAADSN